MTAGSIPIENGGERLFGVSKDEVVSTGGAYDFACTVGTLLEK